MITFLSAFLLFQIELIIAKLFLPSYGGSYLVWGACVVFFQAVLLAGYYAAHHLIQRFSIHKYIKVHIVLLLLPFLFFPGQNIHIGNEATHLPLVADIFMRLVMTIGPVFLVLSTIALTTQSWLSASTLKQRKHPYILYAVSNVGSFAALWSYPFAFEYFLTNTQQLDIWRVGYVILVLLNILCFKLIPLDPKAHEPEEHITTNRKTALRWLVLSAASVVMFLSVTNMVTYEIAPIPLLWIIPLSIYLLSFVLCFKNKPWYPVWIKPLPAIAVIFTILIYFQAKLTFLPAAWAIILFNICLFILCLYAQHELIKSKPKSGGMTHFYVMISLGGFVGGFVTSWIIPLVTHSPLEMILGLGLISVAYGHKVVRFILLAMVLLAFVCDGIILPHGSLLKKRNYYGIYDVFNSRSGVRTLVHGSTLHGIEWNDPERRFIPLGYYSPLTPMGKIFADDVFEAKRVGAVGLGAGTIAMYSKPNMPMDFFELDPDVLTIAKKYFWYMDLAPGPIRVAIGDARISLANSNNVTYDILVIDAFGGDSIPVHLINKDVVSIYRSRLSAKGGILFHIPSRYFDLEPVLAQIAMDVGAFAAIKEAQQDGITLHTYWAVLTWDRGRFLKLTTEQGWRSLEVGQYRLKHTWSDDYSSVLPIIRWEQFWGALTHFKLFKLK